MTQLQKLRSRVLIGLVSTLVTTLFSQARRLPHQEQDAVFRSDVGLVQVYASVFDNHGNPMPSLPRERFQVFDNDKPQELAGFEGSDDKVSCALLVDDTGSMDEFLPVLQNAIVRFADELRQEEEVGVYTFNTSVRLAQPFTNDKKLIKQAVLQIRARGSTALFDAISGVSHDLQQRQGKKAMVLFTDGADNASMLTAPGASRRARLSGVPIYAIAEGDALTNPALMETLKALAADSGGLVFRLERSSEIDAVFSTIVRDMTNTYLLAWKLPENPGHTSRRVRITVSGVPGVRIRAKQSYQPN